MKRSLLVVLFALACGAPVVTEDGGSTGGGSAGGGGEGGGSTGGGSGGGSTEEDAGSDAVTVEDAGLPEDAGTQDAGSNDAGTTTDAGTPTDAGWRAPYDWLGIIGTGQSLSVGVASGTVLSTTPSFNNQTLIDNGPLPRYPADGGGTWALNPLKEPPRASQADQSTGGQYPNNLFGETPHTALASQLTLLARDAGAPDYVSVHSIVGWSGHCLRDINKTGNAGVVGRAYPASLVEAKAFARLAATAGKSYGVGAVILTHGECDNGSATYGAGIKQLQQEYDADLKAITGQSTPVALFVTQQSAVPMSVNAAGVATGSALQVWRAANEAPGLVVNVGPKYQYQYAGDELHLTSASYRAMGEKYARVIDQVVNRRQAWQPLQPLTATRAGLVVTVTFHVPVGPLVFDDAIAPPHQITNMEWKNGRGFELQDSMGRVAIASAAIMGNTVRLTLSAAPGGTGLRVRYAIIQDGTGNNGGIVDGMRGQLRDSDPFLGADAETITCTATTGSTTLACPTAMVNDRTSRDRVFGAGLPATGTVATAVTNGMFTLAQPWSGAGGQVQVRFAYDLRNYAVHFDMPVQ